MASSTTKSSGNLEGVVRGEHLEKNPDRVDRNDVVAGRACTRTTTASAASEAIVVGLWGPRGTHSVSPQLVTRIYRL